ncbi:MAG: flippase [Patescibacteria group bacterium]|nr:flippase [Patescibacteria group bacterium]
MATYTKKIAINTLVQIVGKGITTAIAVVMLAYLARYLGVGGYGEYTTVFAFLGFFAIIADMGFYTVAVREMAKDPESSRKVLGNIFSLRLIFALVLLIAPLVGFLIPSYSEAVKIGIIIGTFSSLFVLLNQIFVSIFQVHLRMDRSVISDVCARTVLFVLTIIFIRQNLSLQFFILANVIANLFLLLLSFAMSRKFLLFKPLFDFKYWKHIIKESLPLGIVIVLGLIYFKIDTIMLSIMKDSTAVGIYGAPYKILEILITIPSIFMGSVFPLISKYIKEKDIRFKDSFQTSFDFMLILAVPLVVAIYLLAKPIVYLVLGEEFAASVIVLQYLIFAVLIIFLGTIMGNFVVAANLQKKLVWVYLLSVFFNITGNLILIPRYSYIGSSITTIATELLVCTCAYIILYKGLKIIPRFHVFLKVLFSALIMGIALYYFSNINLFLLIVLGSIVYFVVLYLIGGIKKEIILKMIK